MFGGQFFPGGQSQFEGLMASQLPLDPDFSKVELLLHCNGTNGSTTVTDSSPDARTVTVAGNAQLSTAVKKFGTASLAFDGTGDYCTVDTVPAYGASDDLTMELWWYPTAVSELNDGLIDTRSSTTVNGLLIRTGYPTSADRIDFVVFNGATGTIVGSKTGVTANSWYHLAMIRVGGVWRAFCDGTQVGSDYSSAQAQTTVKFTIGTFNDTRNTNNANHAQGYMDEIRYTIGKARYTANFTPPARPFMKY